MGDLSTYSLIDFIPFTEPVYHRLFVRVNEFLWPGQILAAIVSGGLFWALWQGREWLVGWLLGVCWIVVGWAFHDQFYAEINWAAGHADAVFYTQGLMLALSGHIGRFEREKPNTFDLLDTIVVVFGVFAALAYPLLAPIIDQRAWAGVEIVGCTPNPTAMVTLVVIVLADRITWHIAFIPLFWCLAAGATGLAIGTVAGVLTGGVGIVVTILGLWKTIRRVSNEKSE